MNEGDCDVTQKNLCDAVSKLRNENAHLLELMEQFTNAVNRLEGTPTKGGQEMNKSIDAVLVKPGLLDELYSEIMVTERSVSRFDNVNGRLQRLMGL